MIKKKNPFLFNGFTCAKGHGGWRGRRGYDLNYIHTWNDLLIIYCKKKKKKFHLLSPSFLKCMNEVLVHIMNSGFYIHMYNTGMYSVLYHTCIFSLEDEEKRKKKR